MNIFLRSIVVALCTALGLALGWAMLLLPQPSGTLVTQVEEQLAATGVANPVTAVLLNFRGYDTLLEIAVLQLALYGVLAVATTEPVAGRRAPAAPQPVLRSLAGMLAPLIVLVAAYLLWAGAHHAGGAFQASAVLASGAVLLFLAGLLPPWPDPGPVPRFALVAGFLLFLLVAAYPLSHAQMLRYPPHLAAALITALETGLTVSVALILSGLFLWLPDEHEEAER